MIKSLMKKAISWSFIISLVIQVASETDSYAKSDSTKAYSFIPELDYDLIADRINCLDSEIPLNYNDRVYSFIEYFTVRDREYTQMVLDRVAEYFPIFERYLSKYEIPKELKYLAIVESGLNPRAISRAGAVGLWQFMPFTGSSFKLHQDFYLDERMDPYKFTEAACKYMLQLYRYFNDWELALAAYNAGPGNVRRAIRRSGYKQKFWEIYRYLPRETRSYVPQFVAIMYVVNYGEFHNFSWNPASYAMKADTVVINQFCHLPTLAKQLNLCLEDIVNLNPAIKHKALPENISNYPLRIPADKYSMIAENSEILDSASRTGKKEIEYLARNTIGSTWGRKRIIHRVRSGDVLGKIAIRYGVRTADIRAWNRISGNLIRIGQRLDIWVYPGAYERKATVTKTVHQKRPDDLPKDAKIHFVQPGDTLWDISRKYKGLSIEKLKKLNNLKNNKIKPGQALVVG